MNSYERVQHADLVCRASMAYLAYANEDCSSVRLLRLKPHMLTEREQAKMESLWDDDLRCVGVLALVDGFPQSALTRMLAPDEHSRLMEEFRFYVQSFIDIGFKTFDERVIQRGLDAHSEQRAAWEVAELERMLALPDLRTN